MRYKVGIECGVYEVARARSPIKFTRWQAEWSVRGGAWVDGVNEGVGGVYEVAYQIIPADGVAHDDTGEQEEQQEGLQGEHHHHADAAELCNGRCAPYVPEGVLSV